MMSGDMCCPTTLLGRILRPTTDVRAKARWPWSTKLAFLRFVDDPLPDQYTPVAARLSVPHICKCGRFLTFI